MLDVDVEVPRRQFPVVAALTVGAGERLALHGPSGAGKTTVLEAIAGLATVRRGTIRLGPRVLTRTDPPPLQVPVRERRVGLLRQRALLFPHLTVAQNLGYAATGPDDRPGGAGGEWLRTLVGVLRLEGLLAARPAALSGGQAQRAALARVLASDHEVLLLDEPLTGQDPGLRHELRAALCELLARRPIPAILVSHDLDEAQSFGDRVGVLDQGRLLQVGPPDHLVRRPATRRVAELVGYSAVVPAARCARGAGLPGGSVAVHPDRVVRGDHPDRGPALRGRVASAAPSGAGWTIGLQLDDGARARVRLPDRVAPGEPLTVTLLDPPCFDPDGALADDRRRPAAAGAGG